MATTTDIPGIHSVPPPVNGADTAAEPKRPRGRPMKCRQCGENIDPTKPHVCATPPAADEPTGDEDFWITISNFTPEEWNHLTAYLYRVMPRIDRKANGKPINLGCYSTAFTREDIMQEHGSGVYRIDVTQLEQASSRSRRIAREVFTIINPKYPPIVPPGDWVDDKVNDMWKWGAPPGVQSTGVAGVGYPPGFNIKDVYDSAFQMAKALTPPPPPAKDDTAMTTLITKLLDASLKPPPAPPPVDTTANDRMFKMMEDSLKEAREEMREMRKVQTAPPPPQPTILQQMKDLKPVVSEFAEMFAQQTGNTPWWQGPLEKLMESVPDVIDLVKVGQMNGQRPQQQPAPQWNPPPAGIPAPQASAPPPQGPPPNATAAATAPQPDEPNLTDEQKEIQNLYQKWGGFILFISPQMLEHFKTESGQAFRDWFLRGHGLFKWADMRRELGPELLSQMIAQHPALSQEMAPAQLRDQFFNEFFEEVPDDDDEEDEPLPIDLSGGDDARA